MTIQRNVQGAGGNFIKVPGEYKVKVSKLEYGESKKKDPMLTVTFKTNDGKLIKGYFVQTLIYHQEALENLKVSAGLKKEAPDNLLMGKVIGILVEANEDNAKFMNIVGYGPSIDVVTQPKAAPVIEEEDLDSIPF